MSNKRILILSDSLALPRIIPEECKYENTWPYLLRNEGYEVIQNSIGGATSYDLGKQCYYYEAVKPDYVIVQVGIVDCAPRFLLKPEQFLLQRIPFVGKRIIGALNKPWVKRIRKIQYVSLHKFKQNIDLIINAFGKDKVFFIGILPSSDEYEKILPGVGMNIKRYNKALRDKANYIESDNFPESGIMSDHHHINAFGHQTIFQAIKSKL